MPRQVSDDSVCRRRNRHQARSEPIQSIGQIDGVRRADQDEGNEEVVNNTDIHVFVYDRQPDRRVNAENLRADEHRDNGDEELSEKFLLCAKPEIALFHHLDIVI